MKFKIPVIATIVATMIITTAVPAFAAAPKKEDIEYEGKGKVEVEFLSKVKYKNTSVDVKDTKGNTYKAKIYKKGKDELKFKIQNYNSGRTYNFVIKDIKARGTSSYGKVKGSVTIPPKATINITQEQAKQAAIYDAEVKYGIDVNSVQMIKIKKDKEGGKWVYELDFLAEIDGITYELEYEINASNGKVLDRDCEVYELDDDDDDFDDDDYDRD